MDGWPSIMKMRLPKTGLQPSKALGIVQEFDQFEFLLAKMAGTSTKVYVEEI